MIKKINNSASLGVGAIGSLSLPVSATEDTLVKVGSETVSDPRFYELFFQLFDRYVPVASKTAPSPNSESQARAIMDVQPDTGVTAYNPIRKETPPSDTTPVTVEVVPITTQVTAPIVVPKAQPIQEQPLPAAITPESQPVTDTAATNASAKAD